MSRATLRRQSASKAAAVAPPRAEPGSAPRIFACAVLVGAVAEGASALVGAYTYQTPWIALVVVVAGFGGGLGGVAALTVRRPLAQQFLAGAACGVAAELSNALWVHAWAFSPSIQWLLPAAGLRAFVFGAPLGLVVVGLNHIVGPRPRRGAPASRPTSEPAVSAAAAYHTLRAGTEWLTDAELARASAGTVFRLVFRACAAYVRDSTTLLVGSAFVTLMLWGPHGDMEMLRWTWSGWGGPGSDPQSRAAPLLVPWDQEWISFAGALVLLVGMPVLCIRVAFKDRLSDYGLGLPPRGRRRLALWSALVLFVVALPIFLVAAGDPSMRDAYPVFRGGFSGGADFLLYETGCLAFFVAIEFVFRGYLLFGLFRALRAKPGFPPQSAGAYAVLLSMLAYTIWHLGKPIPELWGTLPWGIAAGTLTLAMESVWPVVVVHWLLNVILDLMIVRPW